MAILNRVRRLLRADLHAILDSIEDPQTLLKQAIREMAEVLDRKRGLLLQSEQVIQSLESCCQRLRGKLGRIDQDLELSISSSSQEFTRKIIARKLIIRRQLEQQQGQLEATRQRWQALSEELQSQQEQYESVSERAELLIPPLPDDSPESVAESILAPTSGPGRVEPSVSEAEIEIEWLRLTESRSAQRKQRGEP